VIRPRVLVAALICTAVVASGGLSPSVAAAHDDDDNGHHGRKEDKPWIVLEGLNSPKALAQNDDGDLVIGQGAFGPPGPALVYNWESGAVEEVSDPINVVDLAFSPKTGDAWFIGGDLWLYRVGPDGLPEQVFNIADYQVGDPDPDDQDDFPEESNPYGLTVLKDGDIVIADAAANDVLRVTPDGTATTIARFTRELVKTDHLGPPPPGEDPLPEEILSEAVPTSVVQGRDGYLYVSELQGFPFRPGTSEIWRIDPDAEDAVCDVDDPEGGCEVFLEGFTSINDITIAKKGKNEGALYVYELAEEGAAVFEEGFNTGEFPPAVLLEVTKHGTREIAEGQLSQPGTVMVSNAGSVYVTDGVLGENTGRVVRVINGHK
jgi:hypothetical protein